LNWAIFIFAIPLSNWANFLALKALGELQMFFELQKERNNVWRFNLNWVLQSLLTSLSTLVLSRMDTTSAWSSIMASLNKLGSKLSYLFHSLLYISQGVQRFNVNNYLSISLCTFEVSPRPRTLGHYAGVEILLFLYVPIKKKVVYVCGCSCTHVFFRFGNMLQLPPSGGPPLGELTCTGTSRTT
jgi:hypothetical protein